LATARILLVDDDELIRSGLQSLLEAHQFEVTGASNVNEALIHITCEHFDVLLSDLHMPGPGDGLTVVSAMRHFHPLAVTILLTAFPEIAEATKAIVRQTDEVVLKPICVDTLIGTINGRLKQVNRQPRVVESIATILEREMQSIIQEWLSCLDIDPVVPIVPLNDGERCAHLPQFFEDLVFRLRHPLPLGRRALSSPAAAKHGLLRRRQGYTAAMLVEESRVLQTSIFQTLQDNLYRVDFSVLLAAVMTIADEVEWQLAQQMASYASESEADPLSELKNKMRCS
jgi:CheY-like chemotaxis protein